MSRLGPLRERDFRLVFAAHVVSVVGDGLVPVALAFAVLDLTGSAADLGIVLLARAVPMVVFVLAGGVWADRLPRQWLMVGSHAIRFASQTALGVLLVGGHASIVTIAALQVVHGAATAFYRPASSGLVPHLVSPRNLQPANALIWMAISVGGVGGPALAGLLIAVSSPGWAILLDGISFGGAALLLLRLRSRELGRPAVRGSFLRDLADGWSVVRSRSWLWISIAQFSLFQLVALATFVVLGPLVAQRSLGGASAWALIVAASGVGAIAGNALALRFRPLHPLRWVFGLILLSAPSFVLLAVAAPAGAIAAAELGTGVAFGLAGAVWETKMQQQVPPEALSRVSSWEWVGSTALRPLGLGLVGPLAAVVGVRATLLGAAGIIVVSTLAPLALPSVRGLQRLEDPGVRPRHENVTDLPQAVA
ncbi:MAG: MFS transporter [Gaiellaceae bacterium]